MFQSCVCDGNYLVIVSYSSLFPLCVILMISVSVVATEIQHGPKYFTSVRRTPQLSLMLIVYTRTTYLDIRTVSVNECSSYQQNFPFFFTTRSIVYSLTDNISFPIVFLDILPQIKTKTTIHSKTFWCGFELQIAEPSMPFPQWNDLKFT